MQWFFSFIKGISFKTQLMYSIVFLTRYIDLFYSFVSVYNTLMKLFFIGSSLFILYLMKFKFKNTFDEELDTFKYELLLGGCAVLALIVNEKFTIIEVFNYFKN